MAQTWENLLFVHWEVPLELLRPLIPERLTIDTFEGQAWIGLVPFRMNYVHWRGIPPIPGTSTFPELNVRTYVTIDDKSGVWFFSLEAGNKLAVRGCTQIF